MIKLENYGSGELLIADDTGTSLRLSHDQANRLIMTARMHTVAEFLEKLPSLIVGAQHAEPLLKKILAAFDGKTSSERWNLKEKFARLQTLTKGYISKGPNEVVETVAL
jgi:hypothetical protein